MTTLAEALRFDLVAVDRSGPAFARVQRNLGLTEKRLTALRTKAIGFGKTFAAGFGGALAFAAISDPITSVKEAVDEFGQTLADIKSTGLSTDVYQGLSLGAIEANVGQQGLNAALQTFLLRVGEARRGYGELRNELKTLNPELLAAVASSRSQDEALRALADATSKARSAEERRLILQAALGKTSADMVELFRDGAGAIDDWIVRGKEMGLVIERDLLERADKLSTQLELQSKLIDNNLKQALVNAGPVLVAVSERMAGATQHAKSLSDALSNVAGSGISAWPALNAASDLAFHVITGNARGIYNDLRKVIGEYERMRDEAGKPLPKSISGDVPMAGEDDAVLPPPPGQIRPDRDAKRLAETLRELEAERKLIGTTSREVAIYNAHKQAGLDISTQFNASIADAAGRLYDEGQALDQFNERMELFGGLTRDALSDLAIHGEKGVDVLKRITEQLAEATLNAALLGQGPLANLFGTAPASGSGVGGLFGALFGGFRASGGDIAPGKAYKVHQDEWIVPARHGRVIPASRSGGGGSISVPMSISIDARGADRDGVLLAVRRLEAEMPGIAVRAVKEAKSRRAL